MDSYEKDAQLQGYRLIAGVDEAGRGPLAGPVVASAVIFSTLPAHLGIKDSKMLSARKRDTLVFDIHRYARAVGVGIVWPEEVDRINIHKASLLAMEKAVDSLGVKPGLLLIDGIFRINSIAAQRPIIGGDAKSISIAAASIIAKTTRDKIMESYHMIYPGYNFSSNKGYPTKDHLMALGVNGPSPIHRRSFKGVLTS